MRTLVGFLVVLVLASCTSKKKAAPVEGAGSGSTAPILQPVETKLDNAMDKNEDRAKPDPE
jgi:hypothetical protein